MTGKKFKASICKAPGSTPKSPKAVVTAYINEIRKEANKELQYYKKLPSFKDVVEQAALAEAPGVWNGIHDHQRKIGGKKLGRFAKRLLKALPKLKRATTFDALYNAVEARKISGVGELAVYDTALRIGAYRKLEPKEVYLHCGTEKGAKNLGIMRKGKSVPVKVFPPAFSKLKPREIEDCLCIYYK